MSVENFEYIWISFAFPVVLAVFSLLYQKQLKGKTFWISLAAITLASLILLLYARSLNWAINLIAILLVAAAILTFLTRFLLIPLFQRHQNLLVLAEIFGAEAWGRTRDDNKDTFRALQEVSTSFRFMGFGFKKFLTVRPDGSVIQEKSQLKETLLWRKLADIAMKSPDQKVRILLANPLAHEVERYANLQREINPKADVESELFFALDCLKELSREFHDILKIRFYPNSHFYKLSFRMFFSNNDTLFLSFYKWGSTGTDLPFLRMKRSTSTFYLPFEILFNQLWDSGEDADMQNFPLIVSIRDIYLKDSSTIQRVKKYIHYQLPPQYAAMDISQLRIAAVAIAGRDSVSAIMKYVDSGEFDCILPILVGTPAVYRDTGRRSSANRLGDYEIRGETIRKIKEVFEEHARQPGKHCLLLNMLFVEVDPTAWAETVEAARSEWTFAALEEFGDLDPRLRQTLLTPCIPCHVYIHYVRALVCSRLGIKVMIGGDRDIHDRKVKMNQVPEVLGVIREAVKEHLDVAFLTPLEGTGETSEIQKRLDSFGLTNVQDVKCLYEGQGSLPLDLYQLRDPRLLGFVAETLKTAVVPALQRALYRRYSQ